MSNLPEPPHAPECSFRGRSSMGDYPVGDCPVCRARHEHEVANRERDKKDRERPVWIDRKRMSDLVLELKWKYQRNGEVCRDLAELESKIRFAPYPNSL